MLVGHSIAGEELSSVGSRYPEKVSGLIYLDAAYRYAFYDPANGDYGLDSMELRERLERLHSDDKPMEFEQRLQEFEAVQALLPVFEKSLRTHLDTLKALRAHIKPDTKINPIPKAIMEGQKKFIKINVPILAIYAVSKDPWDQ